MSSYSTVSCTLEKEALVVGTLKLQLGSLPIVIFFLSLG